MVYVLLMFCSNVAHYSLCVVLMLLTAHYVLLMFCCNVAHYSLCVVLMLLTAHYVLP